MITVDAALAALRAANDEEDPDYSWADALPDAPKLPMRGEEIVAIGVREIARPLASVIAAKH